MFPHILKERYFIGNPDIEAVLSYLIMAAFFTMPMGTAPPTVFGIAAVVLWIFSGRAFMYLKAFLMQTWFLPVLYLIVLNWIGLMYSLEPDGLGINYAGKTYYWLYGLVLASLVHKPFPSIRFIEAFMAGLAVNALFGILQAIGLYPKISGWCTGLGRGYSTLSAYLVIGMLMASYFFRNIEEKKSRIMILLLTLLYFLHLILLEGRTGYVTFVLLSPLIIRNFFKSVNPVKIVSICLIVICAMFASPFVRQRVMLSYNQLTYHLREDPDKAWGKEYTVQQDRFYMWNKAAKIITENPIAGIGTGSYRKALRQIAKPEWPDVDHPHNDFLYLTVSFGFFGLSAYFWLFAELIRNSWQQKHTEIGYFIFSTALVTLFSGIFNAHLLDAGMIFLVSLTVGFQRWLPRFQN